MMLELRLTYVLFEVLSVLNHVASSNLLSNLFHTKQMLEIIVFSYIQLACSFRQFAYDLNLLCVSYICMS